MTFHVYIVCHHYGCSYCNSEAYEEPSEDIPGVFYSRSDADKYIEEQKRIFHEENCEPDDEDCICKWGEKGGRHAEWLIMQVPVYGRKSMK